MIGIGDINLDMNALFVVGTLIVGAVFIMALILVFVMIRMAQKSTRAIAPLADHLHALDGAVHGLSEGQQRLAGGLSQVSTTQASGQTALLEAMERRLEEVQKNMADTLHGTSTRTAQSLGALQQKLDHIDRAQENIEKLSGNVLSLQDILSNKQRRGMFGEIQLADIVAKALPPDAYTFQKTLSNHKRADCIIHLPMPPGPIAIDAKFPLEPYEALVAATTPEAQTRALRDFGKAVRKHINDIAERYIIDGETADGALMFLPSEAVYAELHARLPDVVRAGFDARVWIVSPTTCMATLNTMRAVMKDARMREQAGEIRKALQHLRRDVELVTERTGKLQTHLRQAGEDVDGILTASSRAGKRAERLDNFDFDAIVAEDQEYDVVPLTQD